MIIQKQGLKCNHNMKGIVFAIYSSFFLALAQVALKKSYWKVKPSVSFFMDALIGLFLWVPVAFLIGAKLSDLPVTLMYAVISAVLAEALYFFVLSKGKLAITVSILSSYSIYTVIFSFFINNERLSSVNILFVALTILGTFLSSLPKKFQFFRKSGLRKIIWPVIGAAAVGLSDTLSKHIINQVSPGSFLLALASVQIPVALIYLYIEKQSPVKIVLAATKNLTKFKFPLLGSLFNIVGTGLLWLSFQHTLASIASPITASSAGILVLFSLVFLNEKFPKKNLAGILLVLLGVFGISIQIQ